MGAYSRKCIHAYKQTLSAYLEISGSASPTGLLIGLYDEGVGVLTLVATGDLGGTGVKGLSTGGFPLPHILLRTVA